MLKSNCLSFTHIHSWCEHRNLNILLGSRAWSSDSPSICAAAVRNSPLPPTRLDAWQKKQLYRAAALPDYQLGSIYIYIYIVYIYIIIYEYIICDKYMCVQVPRISMQNEAHNPSKKIDFKYGSYNMACEMVSGFNTSPTSRKHIFPTNGPGIQ